MTRETEPARLKRLHMRSWRRGTKEMDLILGQFADAHLAQMSNADLTCYDAMLNENDQDLYHWLTGQGEFPQTYLALMTKIRASISGNSG